MNILRSFTETVVTTPTDLFPISFEYDEKYDAVHVFLNGVAVEDLGYTVSQVNAVTLKVEPAIPEGTVRIERETDIDKMKYIFDAGALFIDQNVDADFRQIVHSQQEVRDGFIKLRGDVLPLVHGLQEALQQAQEASEAAQEAANAAEEAALQVKSAIQYRDSVAELSAVSDPQAGMLIYVKSYHTGIGKGGGLFEYTPARQLEDDGGNVIKGWVRKVPESYLNVHNFGATGSGIDDGADHIAFNRVANKIKTSTMRSFTIHIPDDSYLIGHQDFIAGTGWTHTDAMNVGFPSMTDKHVILKSDSAQVKFKDGLRYGVFRKDNGEPFTTTMPFYPGTSSWETESQIAARVDIGYAFNFENIKTFVLSGDLDIDGNMANCVLGGQYGDTGWQVGAYGLRVCQVERFNVENVKTHDHCLDGLYIAGCNSQTAPDVYNADYRGIVRNVQSLRNGRQGCSFGGGQNISFYDCNFADTALPEFKVRSMPMSCFDTEAEVNPIRNARFYNCIFGTGAATSFVSDSGDTKDIQFYGCKFINNLGAVAWVRKPKFKFFNCYFNGYMEGQYVTKIEEDRTLFQNCEFTDDPAVNPNVVHNGRYLINAWGANPIYRDCTMNVYSFGLVGNYSWETSTNLPPEFDNFIVNIYGTNTECAWAGNLAIRIRDRRPVGARPTFFPAFIPVDGNTTNILIEKMDDAPNAIIPYAANYTITSTITGKSCAYLPVGKAVSNATATDDTATKLNALIKSLRDARYIK